MNQPNTAVSKVVSVEKQNTGDPLQFMRKLAHYGLRKNASDIHLRANSHPVIRLNGDLYRITDLPVLSSIDIEKISQDILSDVQKAALEEKFQVDASLPIPPSGRARVNVFKQREALSIALRLVQSDIPEPDELGLPDAVKKLVHLERGLVLLTGVTGSGKSTTIASLLNEVNKQYPRHIVTIEDPIEYTLSDEKALISQREIGTDAYSFLEAMRGVLREDPDVILLGEMRDPETIEAALTAADTGHLVFSTVHAPTATETITRIIAAFPAEAQATARSKLARTLRAVVAQRLLPSIDKESRVLATEVMTVTPRIAELMNDPTKLGAIAEIVKSSETVEGVISFDRNLFELFKAGKISEETALRHATSITDMRLKLQGFGGQH